MVLRIANRVVFKVGLVHMVFVLTVYGLTHILPNIGPFAKAKWSDMLMSVLLSSYFKMFVFAMMVWDFSLLMALIVDMLVLSSNTVAVKVMMNTSSTIVATAVAAGALARTLCW